MGNKFCSCDNCNFERQKSETNLFIRVKSNMMPPNEINKSGSLLSGKNNAQNDITANTTADKELNTQRNKDTFGNINQTKENQNINETTSKKSNGIVREKEKDYLFSSEKYPSTKNKGGINNTNQFMKNNSINANNNINKDSFYNNPPNHSNPTSNGNQNTSTFNNEDTNLGGIDNMAEMNVGQGPRTSLHNLNNIQFHKGNTNSKRSLLKSGSQGNYAENLSDKYKNVYSSNKHKNSEISITNVQAPYNQSINIYSSNDMENIQNGDINDIYKVLKPNEKELNKSYSEDSSYDNGRNEVEMHKYFKQGREKSNDEFSLANDSD